VKSVTHVCTLICYLCVCSDQELLRIDQKGGGRRASARLPPPFPFFYGGKIILTFGTNSSRMAIKFNYA